MPLFVVVLLKRRIYNEETKREEENERRKNERSQSGQKRRLRPILHQTHILKLTSVYQTLNFKNFIEITVTKLLNHKKQNYLFN